MDISVQKSGDPNNHNTEEDAADILDLTNAVKETSNAKIQARQVPKTTQRRAPVYKLFKWDEIERLWKCTLCRSTYEHCSHSGSTKLNVHAKTKHPKEYSQVQQNNDGESGSGQSQPKITDHTIQQQKQPIVTADEVRRQLVKLIVSTNLPFSFVENSAFRELLLYISRNNPAVKMPNRMDLRKLVSQMYQEELNSTKLELNQCEGKVSLIVDCWTSSNQFSFQGVLATWIDSEWKFHTTVLDFTILDGKHSGENLALQLSKVITQYDLWKKLMSITSDNASNMNTMFLKLDEIAKEQESQFSSDKHRVRCLAHVINLACRAVLEVFEISTSASMEHCTEDNEESEDDETSKLEIQGLISKVRHGVAAIRASPQRRSVFKQMCESSNIKHRNLIRDVRTRWNSTLDMLLRIQEVKTAYELTVDEIKELNKFALTDEEWNSISHLIELLKPFKESTRIVSIGKTPVLSDTIALYDMLFTHLEKYINSKDESQDRCNLKKRRRRDDVATQYPDWMIKSAEKGWEKLKSYYPSVDGQIYIVTTVLDPRLKLEFFKEIDWHPIWQKDAKRLLLSCWEKGYKNLITDSQEPEINPHSSSESRSDVDTIEMSFDNMLMSKMKKYQKSDDELRQYLSEPVVNPEQLSSGGCLGWWRVHASRFPKLSKMARDFFSANGSGVSVERLFSLGPDLLSVRRQKLSADSIKECICLKYWLRKKEDHSVLEELKTSQMFKFVGENVDFFED